MRQQLPIQGGVDQCRRVGMVDIDWRSEVHSTPPTRRSLGMNPRENHPSVPECPLDDCGGSVGIFAHDRTPTSKLRAIFPILIERLSSGIGNCHHCLSNAPGFGSIKPESRP